MRGPCPQGLSDEEGFAMRNFWGFRLRSLLPVIAFIAVLILVRPAKAILFYALLPSNGAGRAVFSPPRLLNPADVAVPPG